MDNTYTCITKEEREQYNIQLAKQRTCISPELIKGMTSIRYIIEGNKENYHEQTKNQLECIDEVIKLLAHSET